MTNRARWIDPGIGRFVSQDPFSGKPARPVTLNKYLYANGDPANITDPSGLFGLGEMGIANNIAATLSNIQVNFSLDFISAKLDPDSASASSTGWAILASMVPFGAKLFTRGLTEIRKGAGWVRHSSKKPPTKEELAAAEHLAERTGARIFVRGENQQGADFLMNGTKYEVYSPTSGSKGTISRQIRDKIGRQGDGRLVLDMRNSNLPDFQIFEAIEHAASQGAKVVEVIIINRSGKILYWM